MKKRGLKQKAKETVITCTLTEQHLHREESDTLERCTVLLLPDCTEVRSVVQPALLSWALKSLMIHIVSSTTSSVGVLLYVLKRTLSYSKLLFYIIYPITKHHAYEFTTKIQ